MRDLGSPSIAKSPQRISVVATEMGADVVHAHSSFPGLYARTPTGRRTRPPVVYSPHGFAFERRDVGGAKRIAFRGVEQLLGASTTALAACGRGEARTARQIRSLGGRVIFVPNVSAMSVTARPARADGVFRIGMLGRLTSQKDPRYFSRVVQTIRDAVGPIEALWMGSGDSRNLDQEVIVTGWMDQADVAQMLAGIDLYIHSAAWEGFPLAVLDANNVGLPILVRRIPAFTDLPDSLTVEQGLLEMTSSMNRGHFSLWAEANRRGWSEYLQDHTPQNQRRALDSLWGSGGWNFE
ncbi:MULTISPECIES: glycosyltransferase [Microbacterium]|nr:MULTISPECIES: glycosyltransferase [Microbacterium]